jgi:uncharacterized protein YigA (DUF484 family)
VSEPKAAPDPEARRPSEDQVADYLRRKPDFLSRNPDLIAHLTPPEQSYAGDNVVDFQRSMIDRLRDEIGGLKNNHQDLISTSRGNLSSQARIHEAALDLIDAASFEQFIEILTSDLGVKLHVDAVSLCLESDRPNLPRTRAGIRFLEVGAVDAIMGVDANVQLRAGTPVERRLYGHAAQMIESDALLRLNVGPATPVGVLALGSRDIARFSPGQGTELLQFLARVIESTARAWLDVPR